MNQNDIIAEELRHVPASTPRDRDFRASYQRERLRTLSKTPNEATAKTLIRVMDTTKIQDIKICPRIFIPDINHLIYPYLPIEFVIESKEEDINEWSHLPSGYTFLIFRPASYPSINNSKDFMGWRLPTHAYAVSAWQMFYGIFSFNLTTSYCPPEGGLADHVKATNWKSNITLPWKAEDEIANYEKFINELVIFMKRGEF